MRSEKASGWLDQTTQSGPGVGGCSGWTEDPRVPPDACRHRDGAGGRWRSDRMGASQEQAIVGETPNLAARIQGIASPNAVVICEPTMSRRGIAFDYSSPAELYLSRRRGRHTDYRRFATAAAAIHYAVEELRALRSLTAWTGPSGSDRQSPCILQSPPSRIDIDGLA